MFTGISIKAVKKNPKQSCTKNQSTNDQSETKTTKKSPGSYYMYSTEAYVLPMYSTSLSCVSSDVFSDVLHSVTTDTNAMYKLQPVHYGMAH